MIAVCSNKACNQRYCIKPEMIGRIAKCKKCNNRFKIEELIYSPKPLERKPIKNNSIEQKTKHNGNNKLESNTFPPSSKTESPQAPSTKRFSKKIYRESFLLAIAILGIIALLFIGNFHIISSKNNGFSIVSRDSFGFSELLIKADKIKGMPPDLAMTRLPLGFKILQREGIIKPDEIIKKQIDDKEKREIDLAVRNAQNEINKMIRDAQKDLKKSN